MLGLDPRDRSQLEAGWYGTDRFFADIEALRLVPVDDCPIKMNKNQETTTANASLPGLSSFG